MDLSSLEIFRCVAEEQSVTRAAARLQRVQSNVTTRIRQLEEDLGAALFLRDGKRMTLTDQGREFLRYAEQLLALASEARQSLHPHSATGSLRLGSMEASAASRLPEPLARFHRAYPEVELHMTTGHSQKLLGEVLNRQLDCALIAHPDIIRAEPGFEAKLERGLRAEPVFREELLLVLPGNHPPVHRPEDVQIRTLVGFTRGCTYRQLAEGWLKGTPLAVQEVGSYHGILACVNAGSCIGVLPRSVLELQRETPDLQVVPLMEVDTLLIWRDGYATGAFQRWRETLEARP
ncbi:LysR substrate-binding domain-containing protein [Pseudomonas sp. BGr12]|uniref:LysR substrate-binding domain-containing protein n=1 Tax=Pseudomonas sp. BGr12 TaxID=2936269 RepID=UPI0025598C20|nr:LysR substrate-binding domain-containing protein [Pseudomonas sp. BJa5]MDL2430034.1 LysR family transcriptional regulator [Pseudomonas sp. BJa5]